MYFFQEEFSEIFIQLLIFQWSRAIQQMYDQCKEVGPKYCMQVKYEDLVLHPRPTLKKILAFADLDWTENVMEHQKHMGDISLSSVEKSTDQVCTKKF